MEHIKSNLPKIKYLLFLPLILLSFCTNETQEVVFRSEATLTKDSKVLQLMRAAVADSSSDITKSGTTSGSGQCTEFKYPITFYLNVELAQPVVINSDEELIDFIDSLLANDQITLYFPIVLLDTDGEQTILYTVEELEGTLQMAVDACSSMNGGGSGDDTGSTGDNSGSDDTNGGSDNTGSGDDGTDSGSGDDNGGSDNTGSGDDGNSDTGDSGDDNGGSDNNAGNDDGTPDYTPYICDKNGKKVNICHNGHTICVSVNAIWGHINQHEDDYMGTCSEHDSDKDPE